MAGDNSSDDIRRQLTQCGCLDKILEKITDTELCGIKFQRLSGMDQIMDYPTSSFAQGSGENYFFQFYAIKDHNIVELGGRPPYDKKRTIGEELRIMGITPDYLVQEDYLERDVYEDGERTQARDVTVNVYLYDLGQEVR